MGFYLEGHGDLVSRLLGITGLIIWLVEDIGICSGRRARPKEKALLGDTSSKPRVMLPYPRPIYLSYVGLSKKRCLSETLNPKPKPQTT